MGSCGEELNSCFLYVEVSRQALHPYTVTLGFIGKNGGQIGEQGAALSPEL